ncbi:MAG: hypothetical protein RIC80_22690 [Cyclobacteriaceae bacterium]
MGKRQTIRLIPLLIFLFSVLVIFYLELNRDNVVVASYERKIDSVRIENNLGRGGFEYKEGHVINTDAILIFNPCDSNIWRSHGPLIDFDSVPHKYTFGDLACPFLMFKKAQNDTINVLKDGCLLQFKMYN